MTRSGYFQRFPPGYITRSSVVVLSGGVGVWAVGNILNGNEQFYRNILMPVAAKLTDPETAHKWTVKMVKAGLVPTSKWMKKEYHQLNTNVFGINFQNPIGLAAGFDKDADCVEGLRKLGFGFVEVGSVTPLPQEGNPRPRVFRLTSDNAVINRYGFNSKGHGFARNRLNEAQNDDKDKKDVVIGVNVGKNKNSTNPELDFSVGISLLGPFADYVVVNVSSPNTPGLRALQRRSELEKILRAASETRNRIVGNQPKLLLKVAPDLSLEEKQEVATVCLNRKFGVDGLIVSNTTISRPQTVTSEAKGESGGLSGRPLKDLSTQSIRDLYSLTQGRVPIIGCGGVENGKDAYEKIRAGASLVQFYTAIVYQGFPVTGRIKRELADCMNKDGITNISDAVGIDSRV